MSPTPSPTPEELQTPEGAALKRVRKARRLTVDAAAALVPMSASRWSQIENGYIVRKGQLAPVRAEDGTLAHMAKAVSLTPERLEEVGRPEAAAILREIETQTDVALRRADELQDEQQKIIDEIDELLGRASPRQRRVALAVLKGLVNEGGDAEAS